MKKEELYKFINDNELEYHWHESDVILFIYFYDLKDFTDILGYDYLSEGQLPCILKSGYVALWMKNILSDFNIDLLELFPDKEN